MAKRAGIALFDSGLGGLTVLHELRRALPGERFVYLGDTARTPYGSKGPVTIERYSLECARFLEKQNIKFLIIACNTASAVALRQIEESSSCPVVGPVAPAVTAALKATTSKRIGIIGTRATIASAVYERSLKEHAEGLSIFSQACPFFVPLVEEGVLSGPLVEHAIALYCEELRRNKVDTIILGCTHYPLLAPELKRYFGDSVTLVACSEAIAATVGEQLPPANDASVGECEYFATDEVSRFNGLASRFLGSETVRAVHVEELT